MTKNEKKNLNYESNFRITTEEESDEEEYFSFSNFIRKNVEQ